MQQQATIDIEVQQQQQQQQQPFSRTAEDRSSDGRFDGWMDGLVPVLFLVLSAGCCCWPACQDLQPCHVHVRWCVCTLCLVIYGFSKCFAFFFSPAPVSSRTSSPRTRTIV
uniref:(northern house mosquito) hypothetical protein n=1 Tax=Culex pipiens TaxID=7175 RepID=A0A8D8G5T4_CULPI